MWIMLCRVLSFFVFLMIRRPPRSTRTDTLFPYTTLFRSPGFSQVYFRGVASGENANHSSSLPTVGTYLDEMPVTTIQGALDIHAYDLARVEALAGPQGTLYGASRSEEHTSELQSLMRISYAVFCLKTKTTPSTQQDRHINH